MRILVCGGRDFTDHVSFNRKMIWILSQEYALNAWDEITIVHGAARGADTLAGLFAKMFGIKVESYPADWDRHGKAAGAIRNQQMLDTGIDLYVAFPGGSGTRDMAHRASRSGVRGIEVRI